MELNFTPIRTSQNYGINSFIIPDDELSHKIKVFKNYTIKNGSNKVAYFNTPLKLPLNPLNNVLKDENSKPNMNLNLLISSSCQEPTQINFDFDDDNEVLIENINIDLAKEVSAKLVINYNSLVKAYHNGFLNFNLQENSCLDVVIVCNFQTNSINLLQIEGKTGTNAKLNLIYVDFGCKYSIISSASNLQGDYSQSYIKSLYLGSGENKLDINLMQNVFGQNATATINTIGALFGRAEKNFKGTIDFKKGCKKSKGDETELCMLLSKESKSKALPILLCTEEDVDGSHSSAVSKVNDKELFYVMSRGLSKQEALKLMVKAKFNHILKDVFDEHLREFILNTIDGKIENEN